MGSRHVTRFDRLAYTVALVAVAAIGLRVVVMGVGWFSTDDFTQMTRASQGSLASTIAGFTSTGHIWVVPALLEYFLQLMFPFSWVARVAVVGLMFALASWLTWRCVVGLFGRGRLALATYCGILFSGLLTTALIWWAQAASTAPQLVAIPAVLLLWMRALRSPTVVRQVTAVAGYVVALLVGESILILGAFLLALPFLWFPAERIEACAQRIRVAWLSYAGLVVSMVGYAVIYMRLSEGSFTANGTEIESGWIALWRGLLPALFGGPIGVFGGGATPIADPPLVWVVTAGFGLIVAISYSIISRRAAWRAWLIFAVLSGATIVLVVTSRGVSLGSGVAMDWRYYAIVAVYLPLLISFAFSAPLRRAADARTRRITGRIGVVYGLLIANAFLITVVNVGQVWSRNPTESFLNKTTSDLRSLGDISIFDDPLPARVMPGSLISEERLPSVVLGGYPGPRRYGEPAEGLYLVTESGSVKRAGVPEGAKPIREGRVQGCGWPVTARSPIIPMSSTLYAWRWMGTINYLASEAMMVTLRSAGTDVTFQTEKGIGSISFQWNGPVGDELVIADVPEGEGICVDALIIGAPQVVRSS